MYSFLKICGFLEENIVWKRFWVEKILQMLPGRYFYNQTWSVNIRQSEIRVFSILRKNKEML